MAALQQMVDVLVASPVYLVFVLLLMFLLLVILVLGFFLYKQNRVLARLESQMKGFTPESTNVITNQRLSAVFDQQGAFGDGTGPGAQPSFQSPVAEAGALVPAGGSSQAPRNQSPTPAALSAPSGGSEPPPPNLGQGVLTQYQEGTGEGITEIENKLKDDPNNPDLLDWLAFMYYSNNQLDKAIEIYQRALNLNYENEHQHYYLGNSFYKKGIIDRAIEEWEVVMSLKPNSKIAQNAQERINKARQAMKG
jgi:tetratricopeptide (TPR) repeat protein